MSDGNTGAGGYMILATQNERCWRERYSPINPSMSFLVCRTDIAIIGPIAEKAMARKNAIR